MSETQTFERVRDTYFIDPRAPVADDLVEAAEVVVRGIMTPDTDEGGDILIAARHIDDATVLTKEGAAVNEVAHRLALDFQGAKQFDRLSVSQLHPSDNVLGVIANLASTLKNNNTIIGEVSPVETKYEQSAVRWMLQNIAGYDVKAGSGSIVSGGTSANITALTVAREAYEERGWKGKRPATILTSAMAHYSVHKAARLLAPGKRITVDHVPMVQDGYTMDVDALYKKLKAGKHWFGLNRALAIVAVAGETETGLVDEIDKIAELANEFGVYLHVDGAYGAPYVLSKNAALFEGMSASQSLTCDPHKYMYVPYSCGSVLFADKEQQQVLAKYNEHGVGYMWQKNKAPGTPVIDSMYLGQNRIEGSMGGQAATALHSVIEYIGAEGLGALLDHTLDMARHFTETLEESDTTLQLSYEPHLNSVCIEPDEPISEGVNERVQAVSARLLENEGIYLRTTDLPVQVGNKRPIRKVFRFVATHPYTNRDDVEHVVDSLVTEWRKSDD